MDKNMKQALDIISAHIGTSYTDEQMELASDFTTPLISFSNPGTGKSHSTIAGLIMAQTYHGVPGSKINAMSFTRAATAELKARYDKACKKCDISPTVKFNTFHSICYSIVRDVYPTIRIKSGVDYERDLPLFNQYMESYGHGTDDMFRVRKVLEAVNSLNSALIFDTSNVELAFKFKQLDLPVDVFQKLRRDWYIMGVTTKKITQGDIPIYALILLLTREDLRQKYLDKYRIMVVDEFQDLSLLHLKILSLISSNLVAVGDMKQQIYAFNGSSQQIVDEYLKIYPNARRIDLTQSFRCKNEIADYSTNIYYPNDKTVTAFKGVGDGGSVKIMQSKDMDLQTIVKNIKSEQDKQGITKFRDTMFLFRNNFSATPIAEELYKQNVLFRVNRFMKVMDMPIFKELTQYALIASEPGNLTYLEKIPELFPEFRKFNAYNCPLLLAIQKSGKSLFDINYQFREQSSIDIINTLKRVHLFNEKGSSAGALFNLLIELYDKYIIYGKWWKLEFKKEFYYDLVAPIVNNKTLRRMITEEYDKEKKINDCINVGMGVKCYTTHSAKGLEADDIYIIDVEEGLFPSKRAMSDYVNNGCEYEAAKELRNERSLLYVAITRAKDNVTITYHDSLSQLIANPNQNDFSYLDDVYAVAKKDFDDVTAFVNLFNLDNNKPAEQRTQSMVAETSTFTSSKHDYGNVEMNDFGDLSTL